MESESFNISDNYLSLLSNLSPETKLELISKLKDSLKPRKKRATISLKKLFGAFKSNKPADQIILEIRNARTFDRHLESL